MLTVKSEIHIQAQARGLVAGCGITIQEKRKYDKKNEETSTIDPVTKSLIYDNGSPLSNWVIRAFRMSTLDLMDTDWIKFRTPISKKWSTAGLILHSPR